jgi:hypothetical protein
LGFSADPELYQTAIDGVADRTSADGWPWADLTYAEALYETPLHMHYDNLNSSVHYHLRVMYAGEDYALPLALVANATLQLQAPTQRKTNPQTVEYDLPRETTRSGTLDLMWSRPVGLGGSGRGRQIAQVWLFPVTDSESSAQPRF